jgi:hypothetical protein
MELADEQQQEEIEVNEDGQIESQIEGNQEDQNQEQDDDHVVVTIGEEAPPAEDDQSQAPEWVRELRKNYRELQREKRALEDQLKAKDAPKESKIVLGQKPTLEDCDYDTDRFESELTAWHDRRRQIEQQQSEEEASQRAAQEDWQKRLESYGKAKSELKVKDFDDAEHVVQESLNQTQQGIILQGSENPALLVYALGKNPQKAKELASITDPVKYAFAVAKLEAQLKVTPKKAPPPERTIQGSGRVSGTVDSTLEKLRAEAEKSGDYTKVMQYKRQKRQS